MNIALGVNIPYDINVHTEKGIRCIQHLAPGDKLYEYGTSELLEVQEVVKREIQTIWRITYNDGRISYGMNDTPILYGNSMIPLKEVATIGKYAPIETFAINFNPELKPYEFLFPDPYAAGAFLIHGDYDDPYINLPIDRYEANNFVRYRYGLSVADILGKNKVYFSKTTDPDHLITWQEFFPHYHLYVKSKDTNDPMIPINYTRASIVDRRKFIRGAFDVGYSKKKSPDHVMTMNAAEFRLQKLQKMLWSLGVLSKIVYNPLIDISSGRNFRLEIIGKYERYPGFFYDIDDINHFIYMDNCIIDKESDFRLKIKKIERLNKGWMYDVRLNRPHAVFTTEDFLPRVSI